MIKGVNQEMRKKFSKSFILALVLSIAFGAAFYACAGGKSLVSTHPVEVQPSQLCSDCHTDDRALLDHSPDFSVRHGFFASQKKQICDICHKESFCQDCHANKEEIKPSEKFKTSPDRVFPHRGDYITRHKIDGKIYPALCVKCHGRRNNARCKVCHR